MDCITFETASTIATSIVHSKLDYCNSLFLSLESIQIIKAFAAHTKFTSTVCYQKSQALSSYNSYIGLLKSHHWLKIPERIHFKVLSLTYNSMPTCLRQLFSIQ